MKVSVFILQLVFMLVSMNLCSQSLPSVQGTIIYQLAKNDDSPILSFISSQDTIHFESLKKNKKSDQSAPLLKITESYGDSYNVISYFSGFGYHISRLPNDSLMVTYGDMPYGELIVNGLSKTDQANNSLNVNRLNCVVSINGVRGDPALDLSGNTLDTEKLKKPPIKEILVANNQDDKVFCSARKEFSNTTHAAIYTLQFNEMNSKRLNEQLKVSMLFIFWLYEKAI